MRKNTIAAVAGLVALAATAFLGGSASAATEGDPGGGHGNGPDGHGGPGTHQRLDERACADLVGLEIRARDIDLPTTGAVVTTATWAVETGGGQCRVVGDIRPVDPEAPVIEFQVNLPENWNRRALQFGGGGYDGTLVTATDHYPQQPAGQATPLQMGFVTLGSDGGHKGVGFDATFGLNDEALLNYGQQSIKKTHDVAMELIDRVYRSNVKYFYFVGFSQGGHEALDAAGRYSRDYDGVIAGTPAYNVAMMHVGIGSMYRDALYRDGGVGWINPAKTQLVVSSVYAACDPIDGLEDGIISDIAGCVGAFDVQSLRCEGGADAGDDCLSDAQIETVNLIAAGKDLGFEIAGNSFAAPGPILTGGTYTAFGLGTAPQPTNPVDGTQAFQYTVLDAISKYIVTRDPALDTLTWNPADDLERVQEVGEILDTTDVDFRDASRHTRILLYTGLADDGIAPYNTFQLYDRLLGDFGERKLDRFLRFYTIPGFSHGFGPFSASVDTLSALMAWVERNDAPEGLVATDTNAGTLGRERPLCEYPAWPQYQGGDDGSASSFACVGG